MYINAMTLYFLVPKVRNHNIEKFRRVKKIGRARGGGKDNWKGKINLIVKENSSFEISVYHHMIYEY